MCGIAGLIVRSPDAPSANLHARLTAMAAAMVHRGPDDGGVWVSQRCPVGLATRRLAIRDISPAGRMPMSNDRGDVWISYNGEVYNTHEIRPELEQRGCVFRSHSDTEVILKGYEEWGEQILERLRGMFAFAIVDERPAHGTPRLLLARDRLGIKPVYYARTRSAFVFASELKSLLASGFVGRDISPEAVDGYLTLGSVPNPLTIYREARSLEPATFLSIPLDREAEPGSSRYWSFPVHEEQGITYPQAVEQTRELLEESVRIRLVSDVPLGAFLSGGIDSSAVVALMRRATNGPIRTCSIVFEEAEYSEAAFARDMAQQVGAEHQERTITARDLSDQFDRILWAMDQPTTDGVNTYFVSKTAREAGLTVALSGIGGDELYGGYPNTFRGVPQLLRAIGAAQSIPGGARLASAVTNLLPGREQWAKVRSALAQPNSRGSSYLARRGHFSAPEMRDLLGPAMREEGRDRFDPVGHINSRADGGNGSGSLYSWVSRAELGVYTHNQLLRDTDAMSMAHSLEVREPLLDHRLVEAALRLPAAVKEAQDRPKALILDALGESLPASIRSRTDKQGFTFPFATWMRGPLRPQIEEILLHNCPADLLNPRAVAAVWSSFLAGRVHWSRAWSLAALAGWNAASSTGAEV